MRSKTTFEELILSLKKSSTIVLVGFMGSGKTSFGKELAQKLNYNFLDTDKAIEELLGTTVATLFQTKGEAFFRTAEKQLLDNLNVEHTVVATGGGMPCFNDNMNYLNKIGVTVYLQYSAEELYERLKQDKAKRPLLAKKTPKELKEYITNLLAQREKYYLQAQIIF